MWFAFMSALFVILLMIVIIDAKQLRIPNALNFSLFVSGLAYAHLNDSLSLIYQIVFAAAVFVLLTIVRHGYFIVRNRSGLGFGDVKMLAAASVWIDPFQFPMLMLLASGSALIYFSISYFFSSKNISRNDRLPFGPFIAIALTILVAAEQNELMGRVFL